MPARHADFSRRVALYRQLDANCGERTGFFAAAAEINATLSRLFRLPQVLASRRSCEFLSEAGAELECANAALARDLDPRYNGTWLDLRLVRTEQALLQRHVDRVARGQPRHWRLVRAELNALLNGHHPASWLLQHLAAEAPFAQSLPGIRQRLGHVDFALEHHRVHIGMALIGAMRSTNGMPHGFVPAAKFADRAAAH